MPRITEYEANYLMAERCRRAKSTDKTPESIKHTLNACGCRGTETKTRKRKEGVPRETCKSDSGKTAKSNQSQRLLFPEFGLQSVEPTHAGRLSKTITKQSLSVRGQS